MSRGLPRLMGIVNVTPDSFSDGGRWADPEAAIAHGRDLLADGADILDIGGESTRPGATRPLVEEELSRVVPVIERLAADGAVVSVDTMRAEVARAALDAGASIVNDVSGGLADPEMLAVVADAGATYVAMHWRAHSDQMQDLAVYDGPGGVVGAVRDELAERVDGDAGGRDRPVPDRARPRPRLRQDRRAQLGAAARSRRDRRAGLPAPGRGEPQAFPGRVLAARTAGRGRSTSGSTPAPPSPCSSPAAGCGACGSTTYARTATCCGCSSDWRGHSDTTRPTDELTVLGIECFGHHGVFDFERRDGQTFVIDLTLGVDTAPRRPPTTCATPSTTEVSWLRCKPPWRQIRST